jgi:hypothetical protein
LDVPYVNSLVKILFWRIDAVLGSVHLITQNNTLPNHSMNNNHKVVSSFSF